MVMIYFLISSFHTYEYDIYEHHYWYVFYYYLIMFLK